MKRIAIVLLSLAVLASCKKNEFPEKPAPAAPAPKPAAIDTTATTAPPPAASINVPNAPVPAQGLVLWLRGDFGITPDPGGKVASWAVEGSSLKATADKPDEQPTFMPNGIGGKPAVHFDGEKNLMAADLNINPDAAPQLTVISVFQSDTAANSPLRKLYGHDDGSYDRAAGLDNRASDPKKNYTIFGGSALVIGIFSLDANTPYLTVDSFDNPAKKLNVWVNGAQAVKDVTIDNGHGLTKFYIGGTGTVYHEPWMGDLSEMLVYNRTLTDDERKKVEDYLSTKYGLKLTR